MVNKTHYENLKVELIFWPGNDVITTSSGIVDGNDQTMKDQDWE